MGRKLVITFLLFFVFLGCRDRNREPVPPPPPPEFELIPDSSAIASAGLGKLEIVTYRKQGYDYKPLGGVQVTLFTERGFIDSLPPLITGVTDAAGFLDLSYHEPGNYVLVFEYNISKDSVYSFYISTQIHAYIIRRIHKVILYE